MLGSQPLYQWSHIPIPSEPLSYVVMLSRSQALSQHTLVTLFQALLLAGRQHSLYCKPGFSRMDTHGQQLPENLAIQLIFIYW